MIDKKGWAQDGFKHAQNICKKAVVVHHFNCSVWRFWVEHGGNVSITSRIWSRTAHAEFLCVGYSCDCNSSGKLPCTWYMMHDTSSSNAMPERQTLLAQSCILMWPQNLAGHIIHDEGAGYLRLEYWGCGKKQGKTYLVCTEFNSILITFKWMFSKLWQVSHVLISHGESSRVIIQCEPKRSSALSLVSDFLP